ncbi:protein-L-isoaspartate O-methyltransferase [Streptomyces monticola]|uniref:Protein-L-isoaspartate O-methyltransferase n=1 Tax=Streptomyces monticola TaxID=2666263 RepID=A0ABW2JUE1_9ACTN
MNATHADRVAALADRIPPALYQGTDGQAVRPCTPPHVTERHLRLLDVREGMKVLEIGTGSGLSAAWLAELAGPTGLVTTVESDRGRYERARHLLDLHDSGVLAVHGDGFKGSLDRAPFHRIFAGATPSLIPDAWLHQLVPGGQLLTGVRISGLPGAYAIACVTVGDGGQPAAVTVHAGGYTPMDIPPPYGTTISNEEDGDHALTVTGDVDDIDLSRSFDALMDPGYTEKHDWADGWLHLKNWIIACNPDGLAVASVPAGTGVGVVKGRHAAIATDEGIITDSINSPAAEELNGMMATWIAAGEPETERLAATLIRRDAGWAVLLQLPANGMVTTG